MSPFFPPAETVIEKAKRRKTMNFVTADELGKLVAELEKEKAKLKERNTKLKKENGKLKDKYEGGKYVLTETNSFDIIIKSRDDVLTENAKLKEYAIHKFTCLLNDHAREVNDKCNCGLSSLID